MNKTDHKIFYEQQAESDYDRWLIKLTILKHWPEEKEMLLPKSNTRGGGKEKSQNDQLPVKQLPDVIYVPEETLTATTR